MWNNNNKKKTIRVMQILFKIWCTFYGGNIRLIIFKALIYCKYVNKYNVAHVRGTVN